MGDWEHPETAGIGLFPDFVASRRQNAEVWSTRVAVRQQLLEGRDAGPVARPALLFSLGRLRVSGRDDMRDL
jgi:hypothetical protein